MITKERASKLEGSFGTDNEFFLLKKIRARTEKTERFWITSESIPLMPSILARGSVKRPKLQPKYLWKNQNTYPTWDNYVPTSEYPYIEYIAL